MKVRDIVASALRLVGRSEIISDLSDPSSSEQEDAQEVVDILTFCFNAVEDELARYYIPLVATESMKSEDGQYRFADWKHNPIKIKKITSGGEKVEFTAYRGYIVAPAKEIEVVYEYAPKIKTIDGDSDYGEEVGQYLIALGMASEYSLVNGEGYMANKFEEEYHSQLDRARRELPQCANIPPRRWV